MKMPFERQVLARRPECIRLAVFASLIAPRAWTILWTAVTAATTILYLLPNAGPPGQLQLDKVVHLITFGVIGLSSYLGAARRRPDLPMLASVVLAVMLEWLQGYVPGREYSLFDCGANLVGTGAGFAAGAAFSALTARRTGRSA